MQRSLAVASAAEIADMEIQNNARVNLGDNLVALGRQDEAEGYFRPVEGIVRNPCPQDRLAALADRAASLPQHGGGPPRAQRHFPGADLRG